jgi:cysteine synthase
VIKTPGTESNVKEIFDKCNELKASGQDLVIFNQFDDHGNRLWHCTVTAQAMREALEKRLKPGQHLNGAVFTTGSAGTIAAGDCLKEWFPGVRVAASEALQCPTLLNNGFGAHRIEGIGDKHIPWIHNVRNTDMVMAVDDESVMQVIRLFNEPAGRATMARMGVPRSFFAQLPLVGISGAANLLSAIKMARWYEWDENSVIITVLTDSMEMYGSRLKELTKERGQFSEKDACIAWHKHLSGQDTANMEELTQPARKRIHNLKYYTWVEQQGKNVRELEEQWDRPSYWSDIRDQKEEIDTLIREFNHMTGVLRSI